MLVKTLGRRRESFDFGGAVGKVLGKYWEDAGNVVPVGKALGTRWDGFGMALGRWVAGELQVWSTEVSKRFARSSTEVSPAAPQKIQVLGKRSLWQGR